jgi:hypothetical protein
MNNILDFSDYENNLDVFNNQLEKIRINKNSFNETGVSPLTENKWQYLKRNSLEIEKLFFKNNIVTQKNSLTLVQEPGCSCNISPKEITVYNPKNNIEGYQAGQDEYLYKIKIYTSTRGEVIKQAYYECKVADDEALFFIEDNTGDVSKAKMYAKFGSKVLKNNLINITSERSSESLLKKYTRLDDNILKELIKNGIYEEESSIIRIFVTGFYNFMAYIGLPMKALGWICEKLGEGIIEYLSLSENVWNTSSPDYFLKRENILETLTVNPKLISQIRESLVNDPNKIEINDLIPDFLVNNINLGLASVENLINQYNEYVITTINNLYDDVETDFIVANIQNQISQKVALLCGVWNGLIDFIGGLFVFIGQIAQLQNNIGSNLEDYLERFDNFREAINDLRIEDVTQAFSNVYDEVVNYLKDDTKNDYNYDKIAYFTGFAIAFIATMFIPFTAFAKPLNMINKFKKAVVPTELLEKVSQATTKTSNFVVKAGKETSETALKLIDDIISLLKGGAKAIEEFLQNIWKKIADWFVENSKNVRKIAEKSNILIKNFIQKLPKSIAKFVDSLPNSIQKRILDGLLILEFNGKTLCKISPKGIITELKLYAEYDVYEIISTIEKVKVSVKLKKKNKVVEKIYTESIEVIKNYSGEPVFRAKFIEGVKRDAELVNEIFIRNQGTPPYKTGNKVIDKFLNPGEKFYIVENINQPNFGSWASSYKVKSIKEFRDFLAVATRWKNGELIIKEYEVLKKMKVREDGIGAVYDEILKKWLKGGKQQYEILEPVNKEIENGKKMWQELLKEIDTKPLN